MTRGVAGWPAYEHDALVGRADELGALDQALDELDEVRRARSSWWASPGSARRACSPSSRARADARGHLVLVGLGVGARARPAVLGLRRRARRVRRGPRARRLADAGRRRASGARAGLPVAVRARRRPRGGAPARALPQPPRGPRAARAACGDEAARARARRPPLGRLGVGRAARRAAAPPAGRGRADRAGACGRGRCPSACCRARAGASRGRADPHRARPADAAPRRASCSATASTPPTQPLSTRRAAATRSTSSSSRARDRATATAAAARAVRSAASRSRPPSPRRWPRSSRCCRTTARRVLEGAAVAGDPFEPELAAAAAATSEAAAMDALDELLQLDLVRQTDVPRRFRFRHPLVRRAVYESTPGGWRLGAHERCAEALAARGATRGGARPPRRALGPPGRPRRRRASCARPARRPPASRPRARHAGSRPRSACSRRRRRAKSGSSCCWRSAGSLAATGQFAESHAELLECIADRAARCATAWRVRVITACAASSTCSAATRRRTATSPTRWTSSVAQSRPRRSR